MKTLDIGHNPLCTGRDLSGLNVLMQAISASNIKVLHVSNRDIEEYPEALSLIVENLASRTVYGALSVLSWDDEKEITESVSNSLLMNPEATRDETRKQRTAKLNDLKNKRKTFWQQTMQQHENVDIVVPTQAQTKPKTKGEKKLKTKLR